MTDGGKDAPEPPEEQGNRNVENAVMLGFFVALVAAVTRQATSCRLARVATRDVAAAVVALFLLAVSLRRSPCRALWP